jgi:hypothetical protein
MYKKLSTAGQSDGAAYVKIFGVDEASTETAPTRGAGQTFLLDTVFMGLSDGSAGNHDYYIYLDDMYIDKSRARVELCSESTWAARAHCEIQPPTSWSATTAAVTINQGTFTSGTTAYVYLVDSDGVANATGYPVEIGADGGGGETCSDGIQNQNETGVDCGGVCSACPTCSDGIQNQNETGVDCGGVCTPCLAPITSRSLRASGRFVLNSSLQYMPFTYHWINDSGDTWITDNTERWRY